jgi:hypothetical protein
MPLGLKLAVTLIDPNILSPIRCSLPTSFPALEERKRDGKRRERKRIKIGKKYLNLKGVGFPSSLSHGGAGLDSFHRYAWAPVKTHEAWVYGGN